MYKRIDTQKEKSRNLNMPNYTVSISIDDDTRAYLKSKGYTLYIFKGVDAGKGAESTVWISLTDEALDQDTISISWEESYYIGETNANLENGANVTGTTPYIASKNIKGVDLGKNYIYKGGTWDPNPTDSGSSNYFSIENDPFCVNNFYVSQKSGDSHSTPDYIVVQSVLGAGGNASFIPIETVAMILATNPQTIGTIITQAFSSGFIITMAGDDTSVNITYDKGLGWSGPSGSTAELKNGDSIYNSMLNSHLNNLKNKIKKYKDDLMAIESTRGVSTDTDVKKYLFTATLFFATATAAVSVYNHKAFIASKLKEVVINNFSSLNKVARTFKVTGTSLLACAEAMNKIIEVIKNNPPPATLFDDTEVIDVSYKDLMCSTDT
jgi:hypothetical protein